MITTVLNLRKYAYPNPNNSPNPKSKTFREIRELNSDLRGQTVFSSCRVPSMKKNLSAYAYEVMDEISYFTKQNNIHIITISETWLGPEFSDNYFNLPNFQTVFRQDRNKNGGGVCIFVSDQLSCSRRSDLESQDLELLWVEVFLQQSPRAQYPLLIGCCYRPPKLTHAFLREARNYFG